MDRLSTEAAASAEMPRHPLHNTFVCADFLASSLVGQHKLNNSQSEHMPASPPPDVLCWLQTLLPTPGDLYCYGSWSLGFWVGGGEVGSGRRKSTRAVMHAASPQLATASNESSELREASLQPREQTKRTFIVWEQLPCIA
jgi:hypothetical protein